LIRWFTRLVKVIIWVGGIEYGAAHHAGASLAVAVATKNARLEMALTQAGQQVFVGCAVRTAIA